MLPEFEAGGQFQPTSIEMVQGETSPPSLLTEADLITLMDKHGIGNIVHQFIDESLHHEFNTVLHCVPLIIEPH